LTSLVMLIISCGQPEPPPHPDEKGEHTNVVGLTESNLPPGHHIHLSEYTYHVIIDPMDEGWRYYTDSEPIIQHPSGAESSDDISQVQVSTIVCMQNVLEASRHTNLEHIIYTTAGTSPYCVGGEGKIKVIPQGSIFRPS